MFNQIKFFIFSFFISLVYAGGPSYDGITTTSVPSSSCSISPIVEQELTIYENKITQLARGAVKALQDYANAHIKSETLLYNQEIQKIWNNYRSLISNEGTKMSTFIFKAYPAEYPRSCVKVQANGAISMYTEVIKIPQTYVNKLLAL